MSDAQKQTPTHVVANVAVSMPLCGRRMENGSPILLAERHRTLSKPVLIEEIFANAVISIVDTAEGGQGKIV